MIKFLTFLTTIAALAVPSMKNLDVWSRKEVDESLKSHIVESYDLDLNIQTKTEPCGYSSNPVNEGFYSYQGIALNHIGDIESVWQRYRGDGVKIAVVDSGIYLNHVEFMDGQGGHNISTRSRYFYYESKTLKFTDIGSNYENAKDFEPAPDGQGVKNHGVSVSATAVAEVNGVGIAGIAPNAEIIMCKTDFSVSAMNVAIQYAANAGANIINISQGLYLNPSVASENAIIKEMQSAVDYALSKGVIVVGSAGNDGKTNSFYPASCNGVIGVGALAEDSSDTIAEYSNINATAGMTNSNVDLVAPGTVFTAYGLNEEGASNYVQNSGTSFSAPIVAGAAALYKQQNPQATIDEFKADLYASCVDLGSEGVDTVFGHGALDIGELLKVKKPETTVTIDKNANVISWKDELNWNFRTVHLYDVELAPGYTYEDLEYYLETTYGAESRDSFDFEGASSGFSFNTYSSSGDYLIRAGGYGPEYELVLPDWVIGAKYQFVNNSNWLGNNDQDPDELKIQYNTEFYCSNVKTYIYKGDDGKAHLSTVDPTDDAIRTFPAVTVTYDLYSKDGYIKHERYNYPISIYDHAPHVTFSAEAFKFVGYFTNTNYDVEFTPRRLEKDTVVYGLFVCFPTTFYFEDQGWAETYVYLEYVRDGVTYKPFGDAPGKLMSKVEQIQFYGSGLYSLEIPLPVDATSAKLLISSKQTTGSQVKGVVQLTDNQIHENGFLYSTDDGEWGIYTDNFGEAFSFLDYLRSEINSVEASGNIKAGSVCGLASKAKTILDVYYDILARSQEGPGTARSAIAAFSTLKFLTYSKTDSSKTEYVSVNEVIAELEKMYNSSNSSSLFSRNNEAQTSFVVIVAALSLLSISLGVAIKKKVKRA